MTIRCNIIDSDYRAFRRHVLFRYYKMHWLCGGMLAIILLLDWFGGGPAETVTSKIYALIGVVVIFGGAAFVFLLILSFIRRIMGTRFRQTTGEHVFEISDDGLSVSNAIGKVETRLGGIRRIDETVQYFFVITANGIGYIIPKRDLENSDALRALKSRVQKKVI